jgi:hypothetical protein
VSDYQKRVLAARKEFLNLNKKQEKELLQLYTELAQELSKEIKSSSTSSSKKYLEDVNKMVEDYITALNVQLGKNIKANIETSSQIASSMDTSYFDSFREYGLLYQKNIIKASTGVVKKIIQGNYYADGKSLNQRLWNITSKNTKDIDTLIKINVARGANSKKLADQLERYINPAKRIEAKTLEVGMNTSISYQAQRLARTSITHAFSETCIENAKINPFCEGIKWNLSSSHYERQVRKYGPDICDEYAGKVFKPEDVPLQHPNCLCYFTQENIPIEDAVKELKAWSNGGDNPKLDKWLKVHGDKFGIAI